MTTLKSSWTFWYHEHDTKNWTRSSYKKIHKVELAEEFWGVFKLFDYNLLNNGIFFIMKNDIFPDWKAPENKNGGFWSVKIESSNIQESLINSIKEWSLPILHENVFINEEIIVHGISISPKNNHFVLKIWVKDKNIPKDKKNTNSQLFINSKLPFIQSLKFTPFSNK
tara:strand:- start:7126 stop:7629 length:504 start_codon:yes stop_codon:yes gene_type:complete